MHTPRCSLAALLFATAALNTPGFLHAQTANPPATNDEDDEAVVLSPFEVRTDRDQGYYATNTLAGGRLNTPLERTPIAISVLTSELIADVGATNIRDAMEYATGAGNEMGNFTGIGLRRNDFNFQIRGYRGVEATREYFTTIVASDSFNIDRIDIARGPNSIIFGIGGAGGIIDTTPKRAVIGRDFTDVELFAGSWKKHRASIDANQSLLDDKLAVRLNLLWQEADGYQDFEKDDGDRGALALLFRPTDTTTIRFQGEMGNLFQRRTRPWLPYEGWSAWEAQGSKFVPFGTPEVPETPGGPYSQWPSIDNTADPRSTAGASRFAVITDGGPHPLNYKPLYLGNSQLFGDAQQGQRFYRTSYSNNAPGLNNPLNIASESLFPRTGNIAGPGSYMKTDYDMESIFIDQRVGENLFLQAAYSRQWVKRFDLQAVPFMAEALSLRYDVTTTLPSFNPDGTWNATPTSANPLGGMNFASPTPNPYVGEFLIMSVPHQYKNQDHQDDYRVSATYKLDLQKWGTHNILGFVSKTKTRREEQELVEANVAPDRPSPESGYHWWENPYGLIRISHIKPFSSNLAERGIPDPLANPIPSGRILGAPQYGFVDGFVRSWWTKSEQTVESGAVAVQSTFWNDRITTTAGVRRDSVKAYGSDVSYEDFQVMGVELRSTPDVDESQNTHTFGAVVKVTDWVSVYGNRSTNFRPQGNAFLFGDEGDQPLLGPLRGKGTDAGLKFRLLNDRIHATLGWFEVEQTNASAGYNGLIDLYIDAMWTAIANNGPGTDIEEPHQTSGGDTTARISDGFELELVANLTDRWRLLFNASKAENVVSGVNARLISYVEDHRAEWQAASSLEYNTDGPVGTIGNRTVGDLLTALDEQIAIDTARNGRQEVNSRPWSANLFTTYQFDAGFLKNLTVGGGANYRGDAILGIDQTDPLNHKTVKGNSYILANAMLAYDFKISDRIDARLQLNVDNLLNNEDLQVLDSTVQNGQIYSVTYFFEPRRYSLSLKLSF